ncbi:MAG: Uma2 family endonuclease [Cyanobacteria bacterium P01_F01_bin.143]
MLTTKKLTLQEYLVLPQDDNYCEFVAGQAIPKMSPKRFHSRLTGALYLLLSQWIEERGEIGIEWAVILKRKGQDWVPIPDLLYISYERLPLENFEDDACPIAPELVIEIISPSQSFGDLSEKATDYLQAGVDRVWLLDSHSKTVTIFYPDAPPQTKRGNDSVRDKLLPGLELTVNQIFQQAGLK